MKWISVKDCLPIDGQKIVTLNYEGIKFQGSAYIEIETYEKIWDKAFDEKWFGFGHIGWTYWVPIEELNLPIKE